MPNLAARRDVCVLGAGAAGMSAAVFLKDRGYSVLVLDSAPRVGGQCETLRFAPPAPGLPDWIDVGVQFFANTSAANAAGLGPWRLDSVAFAERFAGASAAVALDFTTDATPNYAVDLRLGLSLGLQNATAPTPAFLAAYGRQQQQLARYPWLDTAAVPHPVPAELLVSFAQFIAAHALEPLVAPVFVPQLFAGGLGDFDRLTALYALLNLSPTVQRIFSASAAGFVVRGGCEGIYDGMRDYLGPANVVTGAQLSLAVRPITSLAPVVLTGSVRRSIAGRPVALPFAYTCDKLVVAYAQLPDKMGALGLDWRERAVFDQVRERYYFTGELEIEGALDAVGAFNLLNLNVDPSANANGTITPALPAITQITRGLPYGPAQIKASANAPITVEAMEQVVRDQLARFPPALLTSARLVKLIRHVFQPHFTTDALSGGQSTGQGYGGLAGLQGRRDTYYLGSLVRFPITYQLWDYSLRFVSEHFPARSATSSSSSSSSSSV